MTLPGFYLTEEEITLNIPRDADLITGVIGPATKGTPDILLETMSEPEFVAAFGRPVDHHYAVRAGIRFLRRGNRLKFVRVAGSLLGYASRAFYAGASKVFTVYGISQGTWANDDITIGITQNSTTSFNLQVYDRGRPVLGELWSNISNSTIETKINGNSSYITVTTEAGVGTTAPDSTTDSVTGLSTPLALANGDDGAFASTRSEDSSTGGLAGKRFYGLTDSVPGSRTWYNYFTITAAEAGGTEFRGDLQMAVQPGAFYVRVPTGVATWAELTDDEDGVLATGMANSGVGQLRDTTNTHLGYIDYRTGKFGVSLVGGPTLQLAETVDTIYIRARTESVGSTQTGVTTYAGAMASPDICPSGVSTGRAQLQFPMDDNVSTDSGIAVAQHDSADANCQVMDGFIVPGTIVATAPTAGGTQTVYDDGFGGWNTGAYGSGTAVVGTVNYRTGDWDITFPIVVPANSVIAAKYTMVISDMGGNALADDGGAYVSADICCTNATGGAAQIDSADANCAVLANLPVIPGSIRFLCSDVAATPETVYDDGQGGLCTLRRGDPTAIDIVGTVDYTTGAWDITFSGLVTAAATITASYVNVAESLNLHTLRGRRLDNTDPAVGNNYRGLNHLNYVTGAFAVELSFAANQNVENNGTVYSVYQHGELVSWGDGTTTSFTGDVADAPIRRQADRMLAFQAGEQATPTAGDAQVSFAATAAGPADYWDQNVAGGAAVNPINFATGVTTINWTAAPSNGEAVFIVSEEVIGHITCKWTGCIGNERTTLTDGLYAILDASVADATKLWFRVMFNDGSGTAVVEAWDLLTDFADLVAKVNATDGTGSNLVTVEDTGAGTEPDVTAAQNLGMDGAFTNADVIGAKVGSLYTGLQLYKNTDTVAVDVLTAPGQWHRQVQDAGYALCESEGRRAHWLYSVPDFCLPSDMTLALPGIRSVDLPGDVTDFVNGNYNAAVGSEIARPSAIIPYPPLTVVNTDHASALAFYLSYYDQYTQRNVWEPPEGDFAQLIAKTDREFERWYPVAGTQRGKFQNVDSIRYSPDRDDRTQMYEFDGTLQQVVNPIRYKVSDGIFIDGQRTMLRGTVAQARDRINVRLLLNKLGNLLDLANTRYEYELNDPILWRQVEATGRIIIRPMLAKRGLEDAYLYCDATTNTPAVIDTLRCVSRLMIKVTKAAEAIEYNVIIVPSGVSFEEVLAA